MHFIIGAGLEKDKISKIGLIFNTTADQAHKSAAHAFRMEHKLPKSHHIFTRTIDKDLDESTIKIMYQHLIEEFRTKEEE